MGRRIFCCHGNPPPFPESVHPPSPLLYFIGDEMLLEKILTYGDNRKDTHYYCTHIYPSVLEMMMCVVGIKYFPI